MAAAIQHGIINTIRDSPELPVVPNYIPSHFAGQGIIEYFEEHNTNIHLYGQKNPTIRKPTHHHPYQHTTIRQCSKCKRLRHVQKHCCDYQCIECYAWGPGHTSPNCPIKKERDIQKWKKEWEEASVQWEITNLKIDEAKKEQEKGLYRWDRVQNISNSTWNTPEEHPKVIDLTSPSPPPSLLPPTSPSSPLYNPYSLFTHPSPLLDFEDIISDFNSVTSSYSYLGNVSDIDFQMGDNVTNSFLSNMRTHLQTHHPKMYLDHTGQF